jgi:hypothetical protein
MGAKEPQIGY